MPSTMRAASGSGNSRVANEVTGRVSSTYFHVLITKEEHDPRTTRPRSASSQTETNCESPLTGTSLGILAGTRTHLMDALARIITSWIPRQSQIYQRQARIIAKQHAGHSLSPTGIQRHQPGRKGYQKQGRLAKIPYLTVHQLRLLKKKKDNDNLANDTTWHTFAQDGPTKETTEATSRK